jgi:hypothetical protein
MGLFDTAVDIGKTLLGGGKDQTTTSAPWKEQQGYLKAGFEDAANVYKGQRGTPGYGGNTFADLTPQQLAAMQGIYGYQAQGAENSQTMTDNGQFLTNRGSQGLANAASRLGGWSAQDPTQTNIRNAGLYSNNPALQGAIDASSRDVVRNLSEVQLPGIAKGAAGMGGMNSSRTGIAEGIALRGAGDRLGDISSTMRADAYSQGLNLSEQARSTNQADQLNSWYQSGALSDRAVTQGYNGIQNGQGLAYDNFDAMAAAGGLQQQANQGKMDADFSKWQRDQSLPWERLGQYQGAISGNWGGVQTNTPASPGWLQQGLGMASAGLGLYGSYKNLNQQPNNTRTGLY